MELNVKELGTASWPYTAYVIDVRGMRLEVPTTTLTEAEEALALLAECELDARRFVVREAIYRDGDIPSDILVREYRLSEQGELQCFCRRSFTVERVRKLDYTAAALAAIIAVTVIAAGVAWLLR